MTHQAFETLLSLELFLPESSLASITGGGARSGTGAGASLGMGGSTGPTSGPGSGYGATWSTSMRKEFIRVRCALDPPQIVQAAKDKGRRAGSGAGAGAGAGTETLPTSLVKWAGSFG